MNTNDYLGILQQVILNNRQRLFLMEQMNFPEEFIKTQKITLEKYELKLKQLSLEN